MSGCRYTFGMTRDLILGDPAYSSWSMRVSLLVDRFDLPVRTSFVTLYSRS